MAVVTLGVIVTNLKGSIAGTTFSNNRAALVAKSRLTGKRNQSSKSLTALNNNKLSVVSWNALSPVIKNDWNNYALANTSTDRYGNTKILTGYNWYISLNTFSLQFTGTGLTSPPAYSTPVAIPTYIVTLTDTDIVVSWSTPIDTSLIHVAVYASRPTKGAATYNRGGYLLLDLGAIDVSNSFSIKAAWEAATGLSYVAISTGATFNISVLIMPINTSSFVSGVAQTSNGSVVQDGIGAWTIGDTFTVQ